MSKRLVAGLILCTFGLFGGLLAEEPADDFARWEKAIAAFEALDKQNPPPQEATLFVGSSSIRLWKLEQSFPERAVINRGFGGSQIADSLHFADRIVLKHRPKTIVFYAGDNDIAKGKSPDRVAADFRKFVKTVHAELPETRIVFIAIKPSLARWKLADTIQKANKMIQNECEKNEKLAFADVWKPMLGDDGRPRPELFAKDGLHLNEAGYKVWTEVIEPHLPKAE